MRPTGSDPSPHAQTVRQARRTAFGARLRALRGRSGLTQEAVALAAQMDRSFYVELELGRRSVLVDRLEDLAMALGVRSPDLLDDGEAPKRAPQTPRQPGVPGPAPDPR